MTTPLFFELQTQVVAGVAYANKQLNDLRTLIANLQNDLLLRLGPPAGAMKFGILDSARGFVETHAGDMTTKVNEPLLFAIMFDWEAYQPQVTYTIVPMFAAGVANNVMVGVGVPDGGFFSLSANVPVPLTQVDYERACDEVIGYLRKQVAHDFPTE